MELPVTGRTVDEIRAPNGRTEAPSPPAPAKPGSHASVSTVEHRPSNGSGADQAPRPAGGAPGTATPAGAPVAAEPPPNPEPALAARRLRVLALDDEPAIRALLRTALMSADIECQPYQDGAQALDGLREASFDVMLIDHRMAGMSGTEFYEAAVEFRPELARRAVFMSGDVLNPDLRGFATRRGIRLLAKPFDIDAVVRVVHEALSAPAQAEAEEARR